MYLGWNIGAVSVKSVRLNDDGSVAALAVRHGGAPERAVRQMLADQPLGPDQIHGAMASGAQADGLFALPYLPESLCVETALRDLGHDRGREPDLVVSLGGESFTVYTMSHGTVRGMVSSNRCAAGSGEFLVQQFGRMGLSMEEGLRAAGGGQRVPMASRCSVHCKSDATHKLNKGECSAADIARSLIAELAAKVAALVRSASWPHEYIVLTGGLTRNDLFVADLRSELADASIEVPPHADCLEALGAALAARDAGPLPSAAPGTSIRTRSGVGPASQEPLRRFEDRVRRMQAQPRPTMTRDRELILGVDAGSTTTKAVLMDLDGRRTVADCYLRTHGNPVKATVDCLTELRRQVGELDLRVIQVAATGSGRDLVSVFLDNCLSFNEILAHARAAREVAPDVDTLFELGGQDAKFVGLREGVPVDYAMNDGCSAGTGSFLEEVAGSDMQVPVDEIGGLALEAARPVAFGERCAAFINTDIRVALQSGSSRPDVLAGLAYAIVDNYMARVVGARQIGSTILLQGGVALNPALAPAVAARTAGHVLVPPQPELMGCLGAALMAADVLGAGLVEPLDGRLASLGTAAMEVRETFTCKTCENLCEIQRTEIGGRAYSFGGLCSRWEMQRRPASMRRREGRDLVALRNEIMFERYAPPQPAHPHGRIGLPLALSTYELYPLYSALLTGLGYEVILSRPGDGARRTYAPICYPGELAHAAVDDLLARGVDYVFLPRFREYAVPPGHDHGYACAVAEDVTDILRAFFAPADDRILAPEIGLARHLEQVSRQEVVRLGRRLGRPQGEAERAWLGALAHQRAYENELSQAMQGELHGLEGPTVVLIGRPYAAFASHVNLSVPRKIASRGFNVVPADGLPFAPSANRRNVWHFAQRAQAAIDVARQRPDTYVCALSCFSCGPDAIMHHRLRHELEGQPLCFLEIDSHTAHAGIETRIGAFLDIIEARRDSPAPNDAARRPLSPARLEGTGRRRIIVTSDKRRVRFDDPAVRHVLLADLPRITSGMFASLYGSLGWRAVTTPDMGHETLRRARTVCTGRECLPFLAMIGTMLQYVDDRPTGEVTVFHLLEQEGPCQIGNWFDATALILERLNVDDAVVAWPTNKNNYLGGGEKVALMLTAATSAGDLFGEVRASLECLATDRERALAVCEEEEQAILRAGRRGLLATEVQLRRSARRLSVIPLRARPQDVPKVLLFGGINRIFVDKQVRSFFCERGILAKTNEVSEFISLHEFEDVNRACFAAGAVDIRDQWRWSSLLRGLRTPAGPVAAGRAVRGRLHQDVIDRLARRWRSIMAASGLLFSAHSRYRDVLEAGGTRISPNGWTEAPSTVGRYLSSLELDPFDGYVNIGAFNCAPSNSATACINAGLAGVDVPYALVEADGTALTPSQVLQLETVVAQCKRRRSTAAS